MSSTIAGHFQSVSTRLRITIRGLAETLIVVGAFALGEPTPLSLLIGGVICLIGEALRVIVAGYGHNVGEIVLSGPYRFVRHPYFLGTGLMFIGIAVASRSAVITCLAIVLMVVAHRKYARRDEEQLKKGLGPDYGLYVATVPAIVPRIWPIQLAVSDAARSRFSAGIALFKGRHREIDTVISLLLAFGLFYLFYLFDYRDILRIAAVLAVVLYLFARTVFFGVRGRA